MNAPFDPKKILDAQAISEELAKEYLGEAQCYLAGLSGLLLQVQSSNESGHFENQQSFEAVLSACESLAIMSLRHLDKLNLANQDAAAIREKVYGLAIAIKETSLSTMRGIPMDEALYGLHFIAKHLQHESDDVIYPLINTKH